jgi:hypothetical protein
MNKQPTTRRRRASRAAGRGLALAVAAAALVALLGASQALAVAPPDERVLERQGRIKHQPAAGQADEKGRVALPPQLSSEDKSAVRAERRSIRPESPIGPRPRLDHEQVAPRPVGTAPPGARGGLVVIVVVAALLLAVGATTTWRVRHRRPQPESSV